MIDTLSSANQYISRGWHVLPLKSGSKIPATAHGKLDASNDPATAESWFGGNSRNNIGVLTGNRSQLLVLDIDPRNGGTESFARFEESYGKLPDTYHVVTGGGGFHLYFSVPADAGPLRDKPSVNSFAGVDIKADGYVVAPPSIHPDTGKPYFVLQDRQVAEAPKWLIELCSKVQKSAPKTSSNTRIPEGSRNNRLFSLACKLRSRAISDEAILAAVGAENEAFCTPPLDDAEISAIVKSALRYDDTDHFPPSDLGNARRLVESLDGNARYVPSHKSWYIWTGTHWQRDDQGLIVRSAKAVADALLDAAKLVNDEEARKKQIAFAMRSQSVARLSAMVELACTEPEIPSRMDAFDSHRHLLNCSNGTIDLRNGELYPHNREDMLTKLIEIDYESGAARPVFEKFLLDIFEGDGELVNYVKSVAGYSSTGETREQCYFVFHGAGANGKSTLVNTVASVLGPYAKTTPIDTLVSKTSGATNDLARLAGARFVSASEANAGQSMADALLKRLTGDEPIAARFLYGEYFEFRPEMKLVLATNILPQMNAADPAIWRRVRTVPFNRIFAESEQDHQLAERVEAERSGILAWIVQGAVRWYSEGLQTPTSVAEANAGYRAENDSIGLFIEQACDRDPRAKVSAGVLYSTYRRHANDNGVQPVSNTLFGRQLNSLGIVAETVGGHRYRTGIKLRTAA